MKAGIDFKTGFRRSLRSWKSTNDPSWGDFSFALDPRGFPQPFVMKGSFVRYCQGVNLNTCEELCLRNCSCVAYANPDVTATIEACLLWFGELIDIRDFGASGQDIYIKLDSSELGRGMRCFGMFFTNESKDEALDLQLFDFATILNATNDFSLNNKLGEGGFGSVYRAVQKGGQEIAVKRLSRNSAQGTHEFKNEVIFIDKVQHRNLVKLLGCCIQAEEKMLIYEYMPNNSLDWFLFDIDMNPKISDFGMDRSFGGNETGAMTTRVVGTHGYMSPEYVAEGICSVKSDVFSFGVLVLEISPEDRPSMSLVVLMLSSDAPLSSPKEPGFFTGKSQSAEADSSSNKLGEHSGNELSITMLEAR
ncbi:hypothetical protein K7X08_019270 [Anisodus acutangulus]|uniref:non-specific serine/threonine protein kinase n=1 Tax=Anisodus acutangulus TaxID=402998 RepID=A0A9Q1MX56_9SOLA|nr:hypothetical protein K7X08_019270 [Anisodus acutangulus]